MASLREAHLRHALHYAQVLQVANDLYQQDGEALLQGLALFDLERENIEAGRTWASEAIGEDREATQLCSTYPEAGAYVLIMRLHARDQIRWLESAVGAILLMVVILNFGMLAYTAQAAENAANYGARRGSVAQGNAVGEAVSAAAYAANQALIGEYTVQAVAPGGIAGSELGIRVTYRVPNLMAPLAGMFPGLPRGDFTGNATAIFRQEGW